jgi:hypothetical protein
MLGILIIWLTVVVSVAIGTYPDGYAKVDVDKTTIGGTPLRDAIKRPTTIPDTKNETN